MFKKKTPVYSRLADAALPKKKSNTKKKALKVGLASAAVAAIARVVATRERDPK